MEALLLGSSGALNPIVQALVGLSAPVNAIGNFGSGFNGTMILLKTINGSIEGAKPACASTLPADQIAYQYECRHVSEVFTYSKRFKLVLLNDESTAMVPLTAAQIAFLQALRTMRGREMLDLDYSFRVEATRAIGSDGRYHLSILAHPDGANTPPYFTDVEAKLWVEALPANGLFDRVRIIFSVSAKGAISCCFGQRSGEDNSHVTICADGGVSAENGPVFQGRSDRLTCVLPGGEHLYKIAKQFRVGGTGERVDAGEGSSSTGSGPGGIQMEYDMSAPQMTDIEALAYQAWDVLQDNRKPYMKSSTALSGKYPPAQFSSGLGVHSDLNVSFKKLITDKEIATERYNYFAQLWAPKLGVGARSKIPEIAASELWKMAKDGETDEAIMRVLPSLLTRRVSTGLSMTRNDEGGSGTSAELEPLHGGEADSGSDTGSDTGGVNSEADTDDGEDKTPATDIVGGKGKEIVEDDRRNL